jgi:hypothetical protein
MKSIDCCRYGIIAAEAKKLIFQSSYDDPPKKVRPIAMGSFYFPAEQCKYFNIPDRLVIFSIDKTFLVGLLSSVAV